MSCRKKKSYSCFASPLHSEWMMTINQKDEKENIISVGKGVLKQETTMLWNTRIFQLHRQIRKPISFLHVKSFKENYSLMRSQMPLSVMGGCVWKADLKFCLTSLGEKPDLWHDKYYLEANFPKTIQTAVPSFWQNLSTQVQYLQLKSSIIKH